MQKSLSVIFIILLILVMFGSACAEEAGQAYYDFGVFAYEDGDYADAEKNLKKAVELNPGNPDYLHFLGKTYLKQERFREAVKYLDMAWDINPEISGLKYDMAQIYYKVSNYSKAAELFQEVSEEEPSNVLAHYHAGVSLFKENRYERAIDYFLNAARQSPSLKATGYYYAGICYMKTGKLDEAIKKFEYVQEHGESESLRSYAAQWLKGIEMQKKARVPYRIYLKAGYQYDDNVRLEPLDLDIYADDSNFVTLCYLSGSYNVVNRKAFQIGAGYSHYQSRHNDLTEYDIIGSIFNIYAKYRMKSMTFSFSYLPTFYRVDSDSYLRRHQFKPELLWQVSEKLVGKFSYTYNDNNYIQNNDRDGDTHKADIDAYYNIGKSLGYLSAGWGYETNIAALSDYEYDLMEMKLGLSMTVSWGLELGLTCKYSEREYDSFFGEKRDDTKYNGVVTLSRKLCYDWLSISGEFDYTKNDSNITEYEYERNATTLSFIINL